MQENRFIADSEIIRDIKRYAIPFNRIQPETGFDDLQPLKDIIGAARIISLGEATHGTHEFFLMKHRLLEFLVQEMSFNHFGIEAGWAEVQLINDYIHTGQGDPSKLLANLHYWPWNTIEILDIIRWMRKYNAQSENAPTISFFGFDMQSYHTAMNNVITYLEKVSPPDAEMVISLYAPFRSFQSTKHINTDDKRLRHSNQLLEVYNILKKRRALYISLSSPSEFNIVLQNARVILQAENISLSGDKSLRDRYMANNVMWHFNQAEPETKMILWAHNAHVMAYYPQYRTMGSYLRKIFGNEMKIFGFSFYQGTFNAIDSAPSSKSHRSLISHQAIPSEEGYEYDLHQVGYSLMLLPLDQLQHDSSISTLKWLNGPHLFHRIGSHYSQTYAESYYQPSYLVREFDVLVYIQDTSPSFLITQDDRNNIAYVFKDPYNLNFKDNLAHWILTGNHIQGDYEHGIEKEIAYTRETCAYVKSKNRHPVGFGALAQGILADNYKGKFLQLTAYIKTEAVEDAAGLLICISSIDKTLYVDDMRDRSIRGTNNWQKYKSIVTVPQEGKSIIFGFFLKGKGQIWIDKIHFDILSEDIPLT